MIFDNGSGAGAIKMRGDSVVIRGVEIGKEAARVSGETIVVAGSGGDREVVFEGENVKGTTSLGRRGPALKFGLGYVEGLDETKNEDEGGRRRPVLELVARAEVGGEITWLETL